MNAAREDDPVKLTLLNLLSGLHEVAGSEEKTAGEIVQLSQQLSYEGSYINENLREAVNEVAFDRAKGVNSTRLGFYLRAYADRIVGGMKLVNAGKDRTNKVLWKVVKS